MGRSAGAAGHHRGGAQTAADGARRRAGQNGVHHDDVLGLIPGIDERQRIVFVGSARPSLAGLDQGHGGVQIAVGCVVGIAAAGRRRASIAAVPGHEPTRGVDLVVFSAQRFAKEVEAIEGGLVAGRDGEKHPIPHALGAGVVIPVAALDACHVGAAGDVVLRRPGGVPSSEELLRAGSVDGAAGEALQAAYPSRSACAGRAAAPACAGRAAAPGRAGGAAAPARAGGAAGST